VSTSSNTGIGIKVSTAIAGTLYFQGEETATLWDNDEYTIPISKPDTYTVKMRFGNGQEISRSIVITGRGIIETHFRMPPAPRNVRAGTATADSIPFSWDSAGTGINYKVYYSTENIPSGAQVYGSSVSGASVTILNPEKGKTYYFWISSVEGNVEGEKSPVVSATFRIPPAPRNVRAGTAAEDSITLSWDSAGTGINYNVYYSTVNNPYWAQIWGSNVYGTSVTVYNLLWGMTYYFWVSAVEGSVEGEKSPVVNAATLVHGNFVRIQGGTFTMGSPATEADRIDNEVQHQVTVGSFYMGKYEVTQREYQALMGTNPSWFKGDNLPVERVTWYDAVNYCNALSRKEGLKPAYTVSGTNVTWYFSANGYRLPTEAEWEYACRAGTTTPYSSGSSVDGAGWYGSNSGSTTHPVGTKQANAWGLYDMHGNVWEWCWDLYGAYPNGSQTDPLGASSGPTRVIRGGSWGNNGQYLRSAWRGGNTPSNSYYYLGFRLLRPSL
jgi:formylglycine-generating enzyme required for sulfatase activity